MHSANLTVDHALADFTAGDTYIMTLKDHKVVGDHSSDSDADQLENHALQAAFKQRVLLKKKNLLLQQSTNKFMPDAQDEEDDWKGLLSKYDDVEKTAQAQKQKFTLGAADVAPTAMAAQRTTTGGQSLCVEKKFMSDYASEPPAKAGFKKSKVKLGVKRQRADNEEDEGFIRELEQQSTTRLLSKSEQHKAVQETLQKT